MKKLLIVSFVSIQLVSSAFAQKAAPQNWFNLDYKKDKVYGVSTERTYTELLKDKKAQPVIVAVIDGGTEVNHEDLKNAIWINSKEIAGNRIDDDGDGLVDDVNGWSYIGGPTGDVKEDTYEMTRIYVKWKDTFEKVDTATLSPEMKATYSMYKKAKKEYLAKRGENERMVAMMDNIGDIITNIQKQTGSENPTAEQMKAYQPGNPMETAILKNVSEAVKKGASFASIKTQISDAGEYYSNGLKYGLNPEFNPRGIVGDNYDDLTEKNYGNNHVSGPKGDHGTHVAGIIAAGRYNGIGMNGVCDQARIMVLRVVPDGDERDKDIANAIRYAADHGAKIINMSFGKSYSPYKQVIDDAVKYAVSKDVLLIHAAGNDAENTDVEDNFPRGTYLNGDVVASWIEVGASSWHKGKEITAPFSNYGKNVDVFAPGVSIYSSIPESKYASFDGTSMASPVTAGVAALLRSYYPELTAVQVKEIIMNSTIKVKGKVLVPGEKKKKVKMTELCKTGGIVNAYEAVKMAEALTKK